MGSVAIKITIPSEDELESFFDIWEDCEDTITKIVQKRVGLIAFTTKVLYPDLIANFAHFLGISYEEAKKEMEQLQEKYS